MKNYTQYEVKITPLNGTSFEDGTWFYGIDIYYHEIPNWFSGYNNPDKIKHLFDLRMVAFNMKECAAYAENIIQQYENGNDFLPKLSDLNPFLERWIKDCWQSENDMWFVDQDDLDVEEMTPQDWDEVEEQAAKYFGSSVIEVISPKEIEESGTDKKDIDYLVCCYGSCINFVNWIEE